MKRISFVNNYLLLILLISLIFSGCREENSPPVISAVANKNGHRIHGQELTVPDY